MSEAAAAVLDWYFEMTGGDLHRLGRLSLQPGLACRPAQARLYRNRQLLPALPCAQGGAAPYRHRTDARPLGRAPRRTGADDPPVWRALGNHDEISRPGQGLCPLRRRRRRLGVASCAKNSSSSAAPMAAMAGAAATSSSSASTGSTRSSTIATSSTSRPRPAPTAWARTATAPRARTWCCACRSARRSSRTTTRR